MQNELQESAGGNRAVEGARHTRFVKAVQRSELAKRTTGKVKQTSYDEA